MSSVECLVNRLKCLKESFQSDAPLNYTTINPEQLVLVTVDLF